MLGMPMYVSLVALRQRVEPRCSFGAEFLLVRADWQTRLDALQDRWGMRLLGLDKRQPRVTLLRELGLEWRLSTKVKLRAVALKARIDMLPAVHVCAKVARVAAGVVFSWSAAVAQVQQDWAVPTISDWSSRQVAVATTKKQVKQLVRKYMTEVVRPAAKAAEQSWFAVENAKYPPKGKLVLADVLHSCDASWQDFAAWGQLRLQGRFTRRGVDVKAMCPLCCTQCDASLSHLLWECTQAVPYVAPLWAALCGELLDTNDLGAVHALSGTEIGVKVSGDLLRAVTQQSEVSRTREGRASLDTTGLHTGLCRPAVECVPSLQEHELRGRPSGV